MSHITIQTKTKIYFMCRRCNRTLHEWAPLPVTSDYIEKALKKYGWTHSGDGIGFLCEKCNET